MHISSCKLYDVPNKAPPYDAVDLGQLLIDKSPCLQPATIYTRTPAAKTLAAAHFQLCAFTMNFSLNSFNYSQISISLLLMYLYPSLLN